MAMALFSKNEQIAQLKLPHNRVQSFADCLFNKTSKTLLIGVMILLFSLPLLLILGIANILVYETTLQVASGTLTEADGAQRIFDTLNAAYLLLIPALVVLFIGLAGLVRVSRRMIFQEHVAFFADFASGVKSNCRAFSLTAFVLGLLHFVMMYLARLGYFVADTAWLDLTFAVSLGALVLALVIAPLIMFQTDLYNLPFLHKLKNAFLLAMRTAIATIPFMGLLFSPWLLLLIRYDGATYFLVIVLLFLLITPLELLALQQYAYSILDRFINKTHHPEIYDKGIYRHAND
ncbi:MAG: hypothetical protein WC399_03860 [Bacilli bacterium]|jgi:hypothetical protein